MGGLDETVIAQLEEWNGDHVSLACRDCAEGAWFCAREAIEKAGYVIVPREPSEAMLTAGESSCGGDIPASWLRQPWRGMIDAALEER